MISLIRLFIDEVLGLLWRYQKKKKSILYAPRSYLIWCAKNGNQYMRQGAWVAIERRAREFPDFQIDWLTDRFEFFEFSWGEINEFKHKAWRALMRVKGERMGRARERRRTHLLLHGTPRQKEELAE